MTESSKPSRDSGQTLTLGLTTLVFMCPAYGRKKVASGLCLDACGVGRRDSFLKVTAVSFWKELLRNLGTFFYAVSKNVESRHCFPGSKDTLDSLPPSHSLQSSGRGSRRHADTGLLTLSTGGGLLPTNYYTMEKHLCSWPIWVQGNELTF